MINRQPILIHGRGVALCWLLAALLAGCGRGQTPEAGPVRGEPIAASSRTGGLRTAEAPAPPAHAPDVVEDGFVRLGFDKLSSFKFDVYEYYSETNAGRPLVKSDDTIPATIKAYDGRRVSVRGFVLPLRTKKGKVIEFLLLKDQGTCCFGPQAQINHFIRVRYPMGAEFDQGRLYKISGAIQVGEVYIQGYLTGIYGLEAEKVQQVDEL